MEMLRGIPGLGPTMVVAGDDVGSAVVRPVQACRVCGLWAKHVASEQPMVTKAAEHSSDSNESIPKKRTVRAIRSQAITIAFTNCYRSYARLMPSQHHRNACLIKWKNAEVLMTSHRSYHYRRYHYHTIALSVVGLTSDPIEANNS